MTPAQDDVPTMEKSCCQRIFLDEFDVSDAMLRSLKLSKKLEQFKLIINDTLHFTRGDDYRKIKKVVGEIEKVLPLSFEVQTYFFSSGENCYTMSKEQKIQFCEMKRPKIAALIEEGEYERALTLIAGVREMTEKADKHQKSQVEVDDVIKTLLPYRKSALLNTTLCLWKLQRWNELVVVGELILKEVDPDNAKALYRLSLAYLQRKEYEKVVDRCSTFLVKHPDASKSYPELNQLYLRCQQLEASVKNKEKNMYKGLLQNL